MIFRVFIGLISNSLKSTKKGVALLLRQRKGRGSQTDIGPTENFFSYRHYYCLSLIVQRHLRAQENSRTPFNLDQDEGTRMGSGRVLTRELD